MGVKSKPRSWKGKTAIGTKQYKTGLKSMVDELATKFADEFGEEKSAEEIRQLKADILRKINEEFRSKP